MTAQEIIDRASKRFNSNRNTYGVLTREDIIDFFNTLPDGANRLTELTGFLEQIPFLTEAQRKRIYSDLRSYE